MKAAILVIDIINDFVTGVFGGERAEAIVPRVKALLDLSRARGVPIVYVTDAHLPGIDGELDVWGEHALEGSWGAEVVEELKPLEGDYRILKRRYSPFYATGLDSLLRELGADTLVLTGLVTNICIQHAAADAFFRGYRVVVPRDCVDAATQEAHEAALSYMEQMYGAEISTSEKVVNRLLGGAR